MKELFYNILEELDFFKLRLETKIIERKVKKMSIMQLNLYFHEITMRKYHLCKPELMAQAKFILENFEKIIDKD